MIRIARLMAYLAVGLVVGGADLSFSEVSTFAIEPVMNAIEHAVIVPQVQITMDRTAKRQILRDGAIGSLC